MGVMRTRRVRPDPVARSAFAGFCFPPDVIVLAVRWCLRSGLSYRDVEELLAGGGIEVDHGTIFGWGPAVHAAAGRGCPTMPSRRRRPLACRQGLPDDRRPLALRPDPIADPLLGLDRNLVQPAVPRPADRPNRPRPSLLEPFGEGGMAAAGTLGPDRLG
jgi:hypothetical protein